LRYAIGSDHAGLPLKSPLADELRSRGYEVVDVGTQESESCDYPVFGAAVARLVSRGEAARGLLICGTGLGMAVTANKLPGIRAVTVNDELSAEMARRHNDANVLCLGARVVDEERARRILAVWLDAAFEGGRHQRRLDMIDEIGARAGGDGMRSPVRSDAGQGGVTMEEATAVASATGEADYVEVTLAEVDPEVNRLISRELERQRGNIELIASENFTPRAVLEAVGSVLTNKYAEGLPGARYYGGCDVVDAVERLAIERCTRLYGAEHANVQPHSGSQANHAVYFSALEPGDRVLAMRLEHGGHLTHGLKVNFSGREYAFHHYCLDEATGRIDYDQVRELARELSPRLIIAGASAYPRQIDFALFREICDEVGAQLMVDMAHIAGLVAGGAHPTPIPFADWVTTTTHKTLAGPRGGVVMCRERDGARLDKAIFPGLQGGPLEHVIAGKAVCFQLALRDDFRERQHRTVANARVLAEELLEGGLELVSGGTDNHLVLIDFKNRDMTGKRAEELLARVGITANKNSVPGDQRPPTVASGLRVGTPAMTTRGFGEPEFREVGRIMSRALRGEPSEQDLYRLRVRSRALVEAFPLYVGLES
jgi:glycine hydroxymethyltransferase